MTGTEKSIEQIQVGQHNALFLASRSGGKDDCSTILFVNTVVWFLSCVSGYNTAAGFRICAFFHQHSSGKCFAAGTDSIYIKPQLGFPQQKVCFSLIQTRADYIFDCLRVKIHRHASAGHNPQHHTHIHSTIAADHSNPYRMTKFPALLSSPCGDRITFDCKLSISRVMNDIVSECAKINMVFIVFSGFCHKLQNGSDRFKIHHEITPLSLIY